MSTPAAPTSQPSYRSRVDKDVLITMRDGTRVAVNVHRPDAEGHFPALYAVSPYGKDNYLLPEIASFRGRENGQPDWWAERGYVYVHADTRGAFHSGGTWKFFDHHEQEDMYDTIEWTAAQTWCSGKVGMIGESYYGAVQWVAACQQPPHLVCIAPYDGWADMYRDLVFQGGIFSQAFIAFLETEIKAMSTVAIGTSLSPASLSEPPYDVSGNALRHPTDDDFWRERSAFFRLDKVTIPIYSMGNWQMLALHTRGNVTGYQQVKGPKKLAMFGDVSRIGDAIEIPDYLLPLHRPQYLFASAFIQEELLRWYDYWLKGVQNGVMDEPPVKYVVRPTGELRETTEWPVPGVEYRELYLGSASSGVVNSLNDGGLSWERPTADVAPTKFSYPQTEWGGWAGLGTAVYRPHAAPDTIGKILTFVSEPLEEDLEIVGPIVLNLWASSDQVDTEFIVKICDQAPPYPGVTDADMAQFAPPVSRGWLRASHRALDPARSTFNQPFHTHTDPQPLTPGKIEKFTIEIWPTSWVFQKGHRILLCMANGDNPISDSPFTHYYGFKMGTDFIFHDREHMSHILLPIRSA